jgi:hypothetical protein
MFHRLPPTGIHQETLGDFDPIHTYRSSGVQGVQGVQEFDHLYGWHNQSIEFAFRSFQCPFSLEILISVPAPP